MDEHVVQDDLPANVRVASVKDSIVVLAVLPFVGMLMGLFFYSCLPLYMLEKDMPLQNLGLAAAASILTRMLIPLFGWRFFKLHKLTLPIFSLALLSGLLSAIIPESPGLIYLNVYCLMLLPSRSVSQAAVVLIWPDERIKGLRIYEGFYTFGYCLSSLWGASLYFIGGWSLCVWAQVALLSVTLLLASSVALLRPADSRSEGDISKLAVHITPTAESRETASGGGETNGLKSVEGSRMNGDGDLRLLKLFICFAPAVIIFAYASEWCIYLVYYSEKFGMNPLAIGIGQMAGDVGGATILLLSILGNNRPACTSSKSAGLQVGQRLLVLESAQLCSY
jgi:hypothetical protein